MVLLEQTSKCHPPTPCHSSIMHVSHALHHALCLLCCHRTICLLITHSLYRIFCIFVILFPLRISFRIHLLGTFAYKGSRVCIPLFSLFAFKCTSLHHIYVMVYMMICVRIWVRIYIHLRKDLGQDLHSLEIHDL